MIDSFLENSVAAARQALLDTVDSSGDYVRVESDDPGTATHFFQCTAAGYRGWNWAVTITRAPGSEQVTVNDIVLLPGEGAILAPSWTPYRDRIQPGDLSPGDILPPEDDDVRLVPAWSAGDGESNATDRAFAREVGLGRKQVLSLEGREMAMQRWYDSAQGPDTQIAKQAPGKCRNCGFLVSLAGPLSRAFGVCANGMANDDGRVVAFDHGCGAHSDARLSRSAAVQKLPPPVYDTTTNDPLLD